MNINFTKYSVKDFNYLLSDENQIEETDNFGNVVDKIDEDGMSYFYISMNAEDVQEAIKNEPEIVSLLGGLNLIEVQGKQLSFHIATY